MYANVYHLFSGYDGMPTISVLDQGRSWDDMNQVRGFAASEADRLNIEGRAVGAIFTTAGEEIVIWRISELLI